MYPLSSVKKSTSALHSVESAKNNKKVFSLDSVKKYNNNNKASVKESSTVSPAVYTSADIAKILKLSVSTARKLIREEGIATVPYTKNILVPIAVFNEWHIKRFGTPISYIV